jgi:hypothetical protein
MKKGGCKCHSQPPEKMQAALGLCSTGRQVNDNTGFEIQLIN